ncbi:GNAT family N-acetyltransferase [Consotaella aegiceratis]|uniref:GNAT family N-acetyltransferase n=1 Tax=Consotaella aegiceratis TaxID=3097961 RepID=UPI002F3FFAAB
MTNGITIRTMSEADLALAVDWAATEGWNPGLEDVACFRAADSDGFLMATEGDEPVASISVVAYGESFGFLGFYIVRPDKRGQGIGWALWQAGMARLDGRTVGLDGVVDQQNNYRKSGFVLAHRNVRYAGPARRTPKDVSSGSAPITRADFDDLAVFDQRHFGFGRPAFLKAWLFAPEHRAVLARDETGAIAGYGVSRPCREGYKIAPLFARTPEVAAVLFGDLTACIPEGVTVILDVPEPNPAAVALAREHSLEPVFETARMYRGHPPDLPLDEIFGLTSFELG